MIEIPDDKCLEKHSNLYKSVLKFPTLITTVESYAQTGNIAATLHQLRLLLESMQSNVDFEQEVVRQKQRQLEQGILSLDILQKELLQCVRNLQLLKRQQKAVDQEQQRMQREYRRLQVKEKISMEKKIKEVEKPLLIRYRNIKVSDDANRLLKEISSKRMALEFLEILVNKKVADFQKQGQRSSSKKLKKRKSKSKTDGSSSPCGSEEQTSTICIVHPIQDLMMEPFHDISLEELVESEISQPLSFASFNDLSDMSEINSSSVQSIVFNDLSRSVSPLPFQNII